MRAREDEKAYLQALETVKIMALRICSRHLSKQVSKQGCASLSLQLFGAITHDRDADLECRPVLMIHIGGGRCHPHIHMPVMTAARGMRKDWPIHLCKPLGPPGKGCYKWGPPW